MGQKRKARSALASNAAHHPRLKALPVKELACSPALCLPFMPCRQAQRHSSPEVPLGAAPQGWHLNDSAWPVLEQPHSEQLAACELGSLSLCP